ncbi:hypothetical protein [Nocardia niigatensis]
MTIETSDGGDAGDATPGAGVPPLTALALGTPGGAHADLAVSGAACPATDSGTAAAGIEGIEGIEGTADSRPAGSACASSKPGGSGVPGPGDFESGISGSRAAASGAAVSGAAGTE